jgi:hypothetical protein
MAARDTAAQGMLLGRDDQRHGCGCISREYAEYSIPRLQSVGRQALVVCGSAHGEDDRPGPC